MQKEFVLCSDHQSLQFLNSQKNLSRMHARWTVFLKKFCFVFKHRNGKLKVAAGALSGKDHVMTMVKSEVESLKDLYETDEAFATIWT